MIGKVTTGSSFNCLFRYLLKDNKQARIIGGDRLLLEPDAKELASQFDWIASTRPTTKKPVKHLSIGFAPADGEIDSSTKLAISEAIVNKLGYTNNQWIAIAHGRNDPGHDWQHDHDHLHIVINGIDFNGDRISDSFDKTRLEEILRGLEAEHKLTKIVSSHECDRQRPKTKQLQRYQRESRKYPDTAPEIPIMAKLEAAIDVASQDRPTMTTFISRMQQLGIDVRPYITEKGRKRISYRLGDFKVRGSKLHNGSFPKLLSERGINFDEIRDTPALEAACQGRSLEIDNKQSLLDAVAHGTKALAACDPQDTEPNGSKSLRDAGALAPSASLSWEQIDLDYWLPQSLKALDNAHSAEKAGQIPDPKQWHSLQKTLLARYGIPEHISDGLNEAGLLDASAKEEPIWHRQSLLGSKDSHFWFEISGTGNRAKKMIVTNSPVEAISAYLVDRLVDREDCPCLYLSLDRLGQLTELDLTKFNSVVVNNSDTKLVSDSVRGLVIQKDVSSWQQSWLAHWNKVNTSIGYGEETSPSLSVKKILSPPANENTTSLQKQTNHSSKQLEL